MKIHFHLCFVFEFNNYKFNPLILLLLISASFLMEKNDPFRLENALNLTHYFCMTILTRIYFNSKNNYEFNLSTTRRVVLTHLAISKRSLNFIISQLYTLNWKNYY